MPKRDHIIVVCTANICRSPMGERMLAHGLAAEPPPLDRLKVVSAGISAYDGDPASVNSVRALKSVGLNLSDHKSQQISQELLDKAFAIFCMTQTHRTLIEVHFDHVPRHLYLFRELMSGDAGIEIPDPFGRELREYEACRDSMVEAIPSLLNFLREHYPQYAQSSS
ncbi:low molecular weight protein arginine phosphatase [Cerasicoccus arenae]|uniref:protein-tyrosine-phosphatase n=2 Tax=Cerasicoccus arenae TaxID=424488 RepID=A0A8J3DDU9_9BACT|nr:low molecular weight protein arginine phosphatase [Cerasicoccus arenae]MBK1859833.1 low molecular weight protein arginine phosphatase [Cerasicoccus arenae]GHC08375.1 protein-tyrosine-phosphatase [Cerasicoccus arenae]